MAGASPSGHRYFDFVAFAPGVHSVLNYGRLVQTVRAFDAAGDEIAVTHVSMNRWEPADPTRVQRIEYEIEDSFDTELDEHRINPCAGTGIEEDYVYLNTFGVLGYFENLFARSVQLALDHDPTWTVGTALTRTPEGLYTASSYRTLVDSLFAPGHCPRVHAHPDSAASTPRSARGLRLLASDH